MAELKNTGFKYFTIEGKEKFYRTLIESSMDAISLNLDGKFLLVNEAFLKLFGYTSDEIYAMNPTDFIAPEDRERVMNFHYKRMQGEVEKQNCTASFLHKSGKRVLTELNATTIQVNGKNASYITLRDITEQNAMEIALRESEAKYKTLVENSQDGIMIVRDNRILFANNTICKLIGYCIEDLMLFPFVNIIHPDDHYKVIAIGERRRNQDFTTIHETFRMIDKNGGIKECDTTSTLIEFGGQLASFFTIHDVTESKRLEVELKENEEKYRLLFTSKSDAIFMIDTETGQILDANLATTTIYGYSHDELLQMKNTDISAKPQRTSEAMQTHQKMINHRLHKRKDGTIIHVELSAGFTKFKNKEIQIVTSRDISSRIQMENSLRESESKYKTLIEKATDGIVITQDGKLKFMNKTMCDMVQYKQEEILETSFFDMVVEEDHKVMIDYHKRRMAGEKFTSLYRSRFIRKDGKIITVELNARTSDYDGKPAAFIIIRDISDRIKIEKELEKTKNNLEKLNNELEQRVKESSESLTEARTQLINLQKENLQSQFDVLKQQVNPHFLFNSLNVLTSLIKLEPDLAEKFSEQLSKVYRYVLENKDNELVDLHTELNFLDAYIFLLNLRFVDKLKVNIDIPAHRRSDQIIPLAMQLLIENAIKHNTMSKSEPLTIDIFIDSDNFLNIVNNLQERPSQLVSTGVGLKNIQNRYLLLNNTEPVFEKTNTHFIAKVPLVIVE